MCEALGKAFLYLNSESSSPFNRWGKWANCTSHTFVTWSIRLSLELGCILQGRGGGSCICPLLWSDLTVASYSILLMCHLLPWCVSSPVHCGCRWYFYCCGHRTRLFPGQCHLLAQWTLEALRSTYLPEVHSTHCSKAALCGPACVHLPRLPAPRWIPWDLTVYQNASQERF